MHADAETAAASTRLVRRIVFICYLERKAGKAPIAQTASLTPLPLMISDRLCFFQFGPFERLETTADR